MELRLHPPGMHIQICSSQHLNLRGKPGWMVQDPGSTILAGGAFTTEMASKDHVDDDYPYCPGGWGVDSYLRIQNGVFGLQRAQEIWPEEKLSLAHAFYAARGGFAGKEGPNPRSWTTNCLIMVHYCIRTFQEVCRQEPCRTFNGLEAKKTNPIYHNRLVSKAPKTRLWRNQ